ncbi:hypothetical protein [Streptomyces canus]|uniref:hypothetical protein n=1 Tax=Streptomyces canus TaxID=58343 RepID=UPI003813F48A
MRGPGTAKTRAGPLVSSAPCARAATLRKIRLTSTTITAEITLTHGDDGENIPVTINAGAAA